MREVPEGVALHVLSSLSSGCFRYRQATRIVTLGRHVLPLSHFLGWENQIEDADGGASRFRARVFNYPQPQTDGKDREASTQGRDPPPHGSPFHPLDFPGPSDDSRTQKETQDGPARCSCFYLFSPDPAENQHTRRRRNDARTRLQSPASVGIDQRARQRAPLSAMREAARSNKEQKRSDANPARMRKRKPRQTEAPGRAINSGEPGAQCPASPLSA